MREAYRPSQHGPDWIFSADGIAVTNADQRSEVTWDDLERLVIGDCKLTLHLPGGSLSLMLGQRWSGSMPPSPFIAAALTHLPRRLLTNEADEALRCNWGWSRAAELGQAERCLRCGGSLRRATAQELHRSFALVDATVHEGDRRECESCGTPHLLDEDQMSDLLFGVSEQWERGVDWSVGASTTFRRSGFLARERGDVRVRVRGSDPARPAPGDGDVHLAVLNALCGELPPT